jgi:hypothetical protein
MTAIPTFAFSGMEASNIDDKMDVASSPYRQADDIDIDLDSVREPSVMGSARDEMLDDPESFEEPPAQAADSRADYALDDDLMLDDSRQDTDWNMEGDAEGLGNHPEEDILYEDDENGSRTPIPVDLTNEYPNDHLQPDYDEFETDDVSYEPEHHTEPEETAAPDPNHPDNAIPLESGGSAAQTASNEARKSEEENLDLYDEFPQEQNDEATLQDQHKPQPGTGTNEQSDTVEADQPFQAQVAAATEAMEHPPESDPVNSTDANSSARPAEWQQQESTTGGNGGNVAKTVHPVTLYYLEEEMSLFPPMLGDATSVYFLSDPSVASGPLSQLLAACRDILAGTLDHHDELVLDIPGLGLHICEDSRYAAEMTLDQILDVYLQLCHNEEDHEVQPLYCHLSSRVSLASQYAYLASASREGRTYTAVAADHVDSPDYESTAEVAQNSEEEDQAIEPNPSQQDLEKRESSQDGDTQQADVPGQPAHVDSEVGVEQPNTAAETHQVDPSFADASTLKPIEQETLHAEHSSSNAQDDAEAAQEEFEDERAPVAGFHQAELEPPSGLSGTAQEHEDGSVSSHTLEGDVSAVEITKHTSDAPDPEDLLSDDDDAHGEDLFKGGEEGAVEADFALYDDEGELLVDDSNDPEGQDALRRPEAESTVFDSGDKDAYLPLNDESSINDVPEQGETEQEVTAAKSEAHNAGNISPPLTPRGAKRRIEDEDELLLLDLDTPDPKRRRPS